ncbi:phosphopantothenoylcysteine decarboxylase [Sulfuricaulis limicola]|uniref:Coenzyme A biosynthesis bifunctional protein CoaBC n=1 Tax=Sulfuricaulis limicola TaxID=1620215 RepID=A0A1B4XDB7_9GAMM|nr:bifunctional phosphopantothenoylcysteine decarboxylase/phosphopantothenate--cysteine ligase CoaBC [Sulfuricaulis limicola]BAV32798.1 phosphopantothenoylcysteine decarboxylase [Sulfuricaulis limicola]
MSTLTNKRILLGVTGGIAAYKSADTVRRLREAGAEVRVILTAGAAEFITALTLQAVSGHPVYQHLLDTDAEAGMGHIELARWADAVLVAPASANFMARLAQGRADDLLSAVCLATESPVAIAPAMNQQMWSNAATQTNLATLKKNCVRIFGPAEGSQACGEVGPGRMLEPTDLVVMVSDLFASGEFDGLTVVVTAGPTWEAIDPVRGLTNRSSGKMGYAVATAAMEAGAKVTLISGPTALPDPERVRTLRVESTQEMHDAVHTHIVDADIFIGVAAVADYRPVRAADGKIKKTLEKMTLELERTPDILASVAARKPAPFTVGFAAETENLEQHARQKLEAKKLDLVAANRVGADIGFGTDENSLLLVEPGAVTELPMQPKAKLARALIRHIATRYRAKHTAKVHTLRRP